MSKYKRLKLARGTKLSPQHIWDDGLNVIKENLSSANTVGSDGMIVSQTEKQNGTFRLNINIPYVGSDWTRANGTDKPYVIPFMLPPLQEYWNVDATIDETTPNLVLTEVSFGFDQRDEGGLITDQWCGPGLTTPTGKNWDEYISDLTTAGAAGSENTLTDWEYFFTNGNHGKLYKDNADILDRGVMSIHLLQKDAAYYGDDQSFHSSTMKEIYNLPIPISALINPALRANPNVESGLSLNINPYKTYLLGITPFKLHDDTVGMSFNANLALVNLTISLKFKHVLVTRDSDVLLDHTPNHLPDHGSLKTVDTISGWSGGPLPGTTISADGADGINTATEKLDKKFSKKLMGGLSDLSDVGTFEHMCQDAGYEVIAVPLWNNQWNNQLTIKGITQNGTAPYQYGINPDQRVDTASGLDLLAPVCDRAVIPLSFPMTVHHVIVAHNNLCSTIVGGENDTFMYNFPSSTLPANYPFGGVPRTSSGTVTHNIGVAVGTGCRGTFYGYKQICNYTGKLTDNIVDEIRMDYDTSSSNIIDFPDSGTPTGKSTYGSVGDFPEWRLNYLPIVSSGNPVSPGFFNQGGTKATSATYTNMQDTPFFTGNSFLVPDMDNADDAPDPAAFDGSSIRTDDNAKTNKVFASDQWIEVRWSIAPDTEPVFEVDTGWNGFFSGAGASGDWSRIASGYGGSWIYIIGKKHTVSDQNWQKPYYKQGNNKNV